MRSIMLMCATAASSLLLLACGTSSSDTDAGQVSAGESQLLGTWGTPDQESQAPSYTFERGGDFTGFDGCNSVEGQWSLNESGEIDLNVDEGSAVGCEELGEPDQVVLEDSKLIARNGETTLWTLRKR